MENKVSLDALIVALDLMGDRLTHATFYSIVSDSPAEERLYEVRCDVLFEELCPTGNPSFKSVMIEDEVSFDDLEEEIKYKVVRKSSQALLNKMTFKLPEEEVTSEVSNHV